MKILKEHIARAKMLLRKHFARQSDWKSLNHGEVLSIDWAATRRHLVVYHTGTLVVQPPDASLEESIASHLEKFVVPRARLAPSAPEKLAAGVSERAYLASDEALTGNLFGSKLVAAVFVDLSKAPYLEAAFPWDPEHPPARNRGLRYTPKIKLDQPGQIQDKIQMLHRAWQANAFRFACVAFDRDCTNGQGRFDVSGYSYLSMHLGGEMKALAYMHFLAACHLLAILNQDGINAPHVWRIDRFNEELFAAALRDPRKHHHALHRPSSLADRELLPKPGGSPVPLTIREVGKTPNDPAINVAAYIAGLYELRHVARCKDALEALGVSGLPVSLRQHSSWTQITPSSSAKMLRDVLGRQGVNLVALCKPFGTEDEFGSAHIYAQASKLDPQQLYYTVYTQLPSFPQDGHLLSNLFAGECSRLSGVL